MQRKPTKQYWRALNSLYGNQQLELECDRGQPDPKHKPKKEKPTCPTEQDEQFVAAAWLRRMNIPHHHSPNGGYRNPIEAAKFKRLGTQPGFPDFWIPLMRKGYGGLYIELKRQYGGVLSEHQKYWRDLSRREGYAWYEAKGASQLMEIVKNYLGDSYDKQGSREEK